MDQPIGGWSAPYMGVSHRYQPGARASVFDSLTSCVAEVWPEPAGSFVPTERAIARIEDFGTSLMCVHACKVWAEGRLAAIAGGLPAVARRMPDRVVLMPDTPPDLAGPTMQIASVVEVSTMIRVAGAAEADQVVHWARFETAQEAREALRTLGHPSGRHAWVERHMGQPGDVVAILGVYETQTRVIHQQIPIAPKEPA